MRMTNISQHEGLERFLKKGGIIQIKFYPKTYGAIYWDVFGSIEQFAKEEGKGSPRNNGDTQKDHKPFAIM